MSVLVKGMDMPKNCSTCDLNVYENGYLYCDLLGMVDNIPNKRDADCPLIEVPTTHGRLIDADDVLTQTRKGECKNSFELGKESGWNLAIEYVGKFAPTIIEAEE